jgi:hypothetical protein
MQIALRNYWLVVTRFRNDSNLNYNASLSIASGIRRFSVSFWHGAITLMLATRFPCEKQLRAKSADISKFSVTNLCLRVLAEPKVMR